MYSTLRVNELKEELKKRGASLQGKKADLVERLESYDRNFNFNNACCASPEPQMEVPNNELYHDVNSTTILPPLTKEHIRLYFSRFNKKTDVRFRLYESRYLLVLRSYCKDEDTTFIKGICKASMKKLQYEVNIKIMVDGSIEVANCKCAVGSGKEAHYKHVAVVMFATEQMYRTKTVLLHLVCTQQLQTFHRPKLFTASPLKDQRLPCNRNLNNIIFHPYNMNLVNKEVYNSTIRNICIGATSSRMPLKQLFGPANPYGILNDHTYESVDSRHILLKQNKLINITKDEIADIEIKTRGQNKSYKWHEIRHHRITASRFHTVCHLSTGRQKSFAEQLLIPYNFKSRATTHGIINELVALQAYMEKYDLNIKKYGIFISQNYPFLNKLVFKQASGNEGNVQGSEIHGPQRA